MRQRLWVVAAAAVALAGCGGGSPANVDVEVAGYAFPDEVIVAAGGEIVFTNADAEPHQIAADDGGFGTDPFGRGQQATVSAPEEPGRYGYVCTIHPTMTGTVVVQ